MYKQMKERNGNNCTISTSVSTRYRYYLLSDDVIIRQVDTHLVPIKCKKKKSKRKKKENKEKKMHAHTQKSVLSSVHCGKMAWIWSRTDVMQQRTTQTMRNMKYNWRWPLFELQTINWLQEQATTTTTATMKKKKRKEHSLNSNLVASDCVVVSALKRCTSNSLVFTRPRCVWETNVVVTVAILSDFNRMFYFFSSACTRRQRWTRIFRHVYTPLQPYLRRENNNVYLVRFGFGHLTMWATATAATKRTDKEKFNCFQSFRHDAHKLCRRSNVLFVVIVDCTSNDNVSTTQQ